MSVSAFLHSRASGNQGYATRYIALSFLLFTFHFSLSLAADPHIEVSPRKITVGDPVEVVLSVDIPSGSQSIFPNEENFAPAEIIGIDTLENSATKRSFRYRISLFEPGETDLPDLPVIMQTGNVNDTFWVDPGIIEVTSVVDETDTSSLRDIRPPVKLPWTFKEMLPYLIGALVGVGLLVLVYLWWRKRKRASGDEPVYEPPPIPPDVVALQRLEDLRVRKLWQDGHIKQFHSELSDILKEYLEHRYKFSALEMTSEEIFAVREQWASDDELYGRMRRILILSDLVKFARLNPLPHDHEKSLELAFAFVEATRPKVAPLVPEAA